MRIQNNHKTTLYSLAIMIVMICMVMFFEPINNLITFSFTKQITMTDSEIVKVGWLELLLKPLTTGVFRIFSVTFILIVASLIAGIAIISQFQSDRYLAPKVSNRAKLWFLFVTLYAVLEVVTHQFNPMTIARVWRFHFNGGASVPTSPISLTEIGTIIEYHYMVSIRRFFADMDRSWLEWGIIVALVVWAIAKAHTIAKRNVNNATNRKELLTQIPAAVLALLAAIAAPYRLAPRSEEDKQRDWNDIDQTLVNLHVSTKIRAAMYEKMAEPDSIASMMQDRQGSHIHKIMDAADPHKQSQM